MSFQSSGSRSNYLGALSQIKTCHFQLNQRFFVFTRAGSVPCRSLAVLCAVLLLPRERGGSSPPPGWIWPGRTEGQGAVSPRLCSAGELGDDAGWRPGSRGKQAAWLQHPFNKAKQTLLIYVCRNVSKQNTLRSWGFLMDGTPVCNVL